jgi:hypothetical protein
MYGFMRLFGGHPRDLSVAVARRSCQPACLYLVNMRSPPARERPRINSTIDLIHRH